MDKPKRGRKPDLSSTGERLGKRSYYVYPYQVAWVEGNGGSKLIRELIDRRMGRALIRGGR